jgi:hypothetical protein
MAVSCPPTVQPTLQMLSAYIQAGFHWPNEICEWPVCLMRWEDKSTSGSGTASKLEVVDEFRSFVKPTWAPILSPFCTNLTGITQAGRLCCSSHPDH